MERFDLLHLQEGDVLAGARVIQSFFAWCGKRRHFFVKSRAERAHQGRTVERTQAVAAPGEAHSAQGTQFWSLDLV